MTLEIYSQQITSLKQQLGPVSDLKYLLFMKKVLVLFWLRIRRGKYVQIFFAFVKYSTFVFISSRFSFPIFHLGHRLNQLYILGRGGGVGYP